jgi:formate dehydrogenase beta subunit
MTRFPRRHFLAACGAAAAAYAVNHSVVEASNPVPPPEDAVGMLYDTTLCIGCKACVAACNDRNDLTPDTGRSDGLWQMPDDLNPQTKNIIKLYRDDDAGEWSFVKRQCMHCVDPACVAGCPFGALEKGENGIVGWDGDRCIGCRYCEVSCPFDIPKFEWDRFNPQIVKCELCRHALAEDGQPACTRVCPTGAVTYGARDDLLDEAHRRIEDAPGKYADDRVYGEHDGGGTQVLYLSHVPFTRLGLPELGDVSVQRRSASAHHWITKWGAFPLAAYAVMLACILRNWKHHDSETRRIEAEGGLRDQL